MIHPKTKILKAIKIILKTLLILIVVLGIFILFFTLIRNRISNDKAKLKEKQTIDLVSGYNQVKDIQQILKNAGFYKGSVDGIIGSKTRQAIREFQKAKGLKSTGKIDQETQLALTREKKNSTQIKKRATEKTATKTLKIKEPKIVEPSKDQSEIQNEIMGYRLQSKNRTEQIQIALKEAEFYKGEVDGKIGEGTKEAIKAFQKSKGLVADGIVGPKTWEELSKYLK